MFVRHLTKEGHRERAHGESCLGRVFCCAVLFFFLCPAVLWASGKVTRALEEEEALLRKGQESQARIDAMAGETRELLAEYRDLKRQQENLTIYNDNLEEMTRSQVAEMASLQQQIEDIQVTQREIVPLMLRMLDTLEGFVAADIPFLKPERQARVEGLQALMGRADVDIPEKFRQIMLAYQTEADYGKTIEAYQGELTLDGKERSVEFLRIGRVVLAYQTLDRRESGFWDVRKQDWVHLEKRHNRSIRQGIRIADRQAAPELVQVPVVISEVEP